VTEIVGRWKKIDEGCRACGASSAEYKWGKDMASRKEYIRLTCRRCGYVWDAIPLHCND